MLLLSQVLPAFLFSIVIANFTLKDINSKDVTLDSLLVKGPVVLEFWATYCTPCVKQLNCFNIMKAEFDTSTAIPESIKISFVGIAEDGPGSRKNVIPVVKEKKWNFIIVYDDNKKMMKAYQVDAIPQTFVIGKNREVVYHHVGYKKGDEKIIREKVLAYIKRLG